MKTENKSNQELQILTEKLHAKIEAGQQKSKNYLSVIQNDGNLLEDHVIGVGKNNAISFHSGNDNKVVMQIQNGNTKRFTLHKNAVNQLGAKFGISASYLHNLNEINSDWSAKLEAHILNVHSEHTDRQRVLIRSVAGEARGILSDSYRRLNTQEIYTKFLKGVSNQGLQVYDCYASELKSYIEAITPEVFEIPGESGLSTHVAYGVRISNSDFGNAALEIRSFILQVICLNGMVRDSVLKQIHLGSRLPQNLNLSNKTYQLDTLTTGSAVNDIIDGMFNKTSLLEQSRSIQKSMSTNVDYDNELTKLVKVGVTKEEITEVKDTLLLHKKSDGIITEEPSLWNLAQGISAIARNKAEERKRDLEEISGALLKKV